MSDAVAIEIDDAFAGDTAAPVNNDNDKPKVANVSTINEKQKTNPPTAATATTTTASMIVNPHDAEYLALVKRVLTLGKERSDRTGTGTISRFGESLTFDLTGNQLPLLSCKRVNYHAVLTELLWFLRGSTDSLELERDNVHIWMPHGARENLDRLGFTHLKTGQLGPIYGHQWRKAAYDQIAYALRLLRDEPTSRRILINSWNVADVGQMVLPPCHVSFQLYVEADNSLSGLLYLRSSDIGLGLPFNIASYATLLHLFAIESQRTARTLKIFIGDAHIYNDHRDQLAKLFDKPQYPSAKLHIRLHGEDESHDLGDYKLDDFTVVDYRSNEYVRLKMSV